MERFAMPGSDLDELESVVASVLRSVRADSDSVRLPGTMLEGCAREAVARLWDCPVKIYVPLLALRRVRCCVRAGCCDCGDC